MKPKHSSSKGLEIIKTYKNNLLQSIEQLTCNYKKPFTENDAIW